jgi:hypothetical protein
MALQQLSFINSSYNLVLTQHFVKNKTHWGALTIY